MNRKKTKGLRRGFFIVFEGIDGSGKTTQSISLNKFLNEKGYDTVLLREPTDGPWGGKIRDILLNGRKGISPREELDLFVKDRKYNLDKNVLPAIKENKIIVQDRYYFSSIAYQGALNIEPHQIRITNEAFALKPDLVFYLQINTKTGLKRIETGRKEKRDAFEKEQYLKKVKKNFDSFNDPFIKKIDGSLSSSTIQKKIQKITIEKLSFINK